MNGQFRQNADIKGLGGSTETIRSVLLACAIGFGLALAITKWWTCAVC